ncbi:MAG: pilus assembly protein TadG-related protein, partial [Candidatus Korobacteraceae bacterium]
MRWRKEIGGSDPHRAHRRRDRGQAAIAIVLAMGLILLGMMGLAVDYTNLIFHRQAAQGAAESACTAGAMDMLVKASGVTPPSMGFTAGTSGKCSVGGGGPICSYAKFNGYSATPTGLSSTATSNDIYWSFPGSVTGVTAPATSVVPYPFLKVSVAETIPTWFRALYGTNYQQVAASSTCGLVNVMSAAPIIVLDPSSSGTLNSSGGSHIVVVGGPSRSIQVNSSSATAVVCSGGSGNPITTSAAGPTGLGADIGLVGGPASNFKCGANNVFNGGTNGKWVSPVLPIPNPYAGVPSPTLPSPPTVALNPVPGAPARPATTGTWVAYGTDSCPDKTQTYLTYSAKYGNVYGNCLEFTPGYYPSGISVDSYTNYTAIFMPGIYYLNGNLHSASSNTLRNAWIGTQPSTGGVMFYFLSGG